MELSSPVARICWCCLLMVSASAIAQTTNLRQPTPVGRPGCPSRCGNLTIPYPFGIGKSNGCAYDSAFEIICDINSNNLIVLTNCYDSQGALLRMPFPYNLSYSTLDRRRNSHYSLSLENKFTTVGCDDTMVISDGAKEISTCTSRCSNPSQVPDNGTCFGIGCCQLPVPKDPNKAYHISIISALNHTKVWSFNPCAHMFLGDTSRFRFLGASDLSNPNFRQRVVDSVAVVLDWAIGDFSCKEAQNGSGYACQANSHCVDSDTGFGGYLCTCDHGYEGNPYLGCTDRPIGKLSCNQAQNSSGYACQANSHCVDSDTALGGYSCHCNHGYEGNPYLSPGCTDIDECKNPEMMKSCEQLCINFPGGFNCSCLEGYYGDGRKGGQGCVLINKKSAPSWFKLSLGIGLGSFVLVAIATSLSYIIKKTNHAKMRFKFFEQNGGFLLMQKITSSEGSSNDTDVTKNFSAKELREATKRARSIACQSSAEVFLPIARCMVSSVRDEIIMDMIDLS